MVDPHRVRRLSLPEEAGVRRSRRFDWQSRGQIIRRHLLQNVRGVIVVSCTLDVALIMLAEAGLSFRGLGVPPGIPTWGNMISESRTDDLTDPVLAIPPAWR